MINNNGNYEFLDFEGVRENLIKAFTEYYGEEHADEVRKRLEKVKYVPFIGYDSLHTFCSIMLNGHQDEIIKEYKKISGRKHLTAEMKDMIWSEGGSMFFGALTDGENLQYNTFLASYEDAMNCRQDVCRAFGITDENPVPTIKQECRNLRKALIKVMKEHSNPTFVDVNKVMKNKITALQNFINYVDLFNFSVSKHDRDLINSPTFDAYDLQSLDCKYILFGADITIPGLIQYFTSEAEQRLNFGTIEDIRQVLTGRARYMLLNNGSDALQFVTEDELFGRIKITNMKDFLNRCKEEIAYQQEQDPSNIVPVGSADAIEIHRQLLCKSLYTGCKFAENLNRRHNGGVFNPDFEKTFWFTTVEYEGSNINKPLNHLVFDESPEIYANSQINSLCHECNHAISNGRPIVKGKKVFSRLGMTGFHTTVDKYGRVEPLVKSNADYTEGELLLEENINQRMGTEITDIYLKHFPNPYRDSNLPDLRKRNLFCTYNYYDFLVDDFYKKYGDAIREFRINEDTPLYYDNDLIPPKGLIKRGARSVQYFVDKYTQPTKTKSSGVLSHRLVREFGFVLSAFKNHIVGTLEAKDIDSTKFTSIESISEIEELTPQELEHIKTYKREVDRIMALMEQEEQKLEALSQKEQAIKNKKDQIISHCKNKGKKLLHRIIPESKKEENKEDYEQLVMEDWEK